MRYGTDDEVTEIKMFEELETGELQEVETNETIEISIDQNGELFLPISGQFVSLQLGRPAILNQNGKIVLCVDSD